MPRQEARPVHARAHLLAALLLAAIAILWPGTSRADAAIVAENGFTSAADGYSFRNYGSSEGYRDLTAAEMRRLFGGGVCSSTSDGGCTLTPEAQAWMESTNASMSGGHCFGMATSSQLWFEGKGKPPSPSPFGSSTTPGLQIDGNRKLQSHIAYLWTLQLMPAVQSATTDLSPNGVVAQLERELVPGNAKRVLTIYDDGDGHAITPIAVDDAGPGLKRIAIYDNNWPGQTRFIDIDTTKNTWRYELGPGVVWSGSAKTKSIQLADPSAGLGHQPCFICAQRGGGDGPGKSVQLRLTGDPRNGRHGSILAVDGKGNRTGLGPEGTVNEIKGARLSLPTTGPQPYRTAAPPTIDLPTRNSYRVELGSTSKRGQVSEDVRLIGRGFSLGADGVRIQKGETDQLRIARRARSVAFVNDARGIESPTIVATASNLKGGSDFEIELRPAGVNRDAAIGARFDPRTKKLRITNEDGSRAEQVDIAITVYSAKGTGQQTKTVRVKRGGKTLQL